MKLRSHVIPLLVASCCTSASPPPRFGERETRDAAASLAELPPTSLPVRTYAASTGALDNPERGLYSRVDIMKDVASGLAAAPTTLLHSYLRLDAFRAAPIDAAWLAQLEAGLVAVRAARKKVILRFSYNFGPWPNCEPDAPRSRILEHIAQVAPVLHAHAAVIAWFEAGFIGCWGEWHTSTNRLEHDDAGKQSIVAEMLARWPEAYIQLRYPVDLRMLRSALVRRGLDERAIARLGFHHDCVFASDPDDYGTWGRHGGDIERDKELIAEVSAFAPTGGETCALSPRAHCRTAMIELPALRFTDLNNDYNRDVLDVFRAEGCWDEIERRLGHRLRAVDAVVPESVDPGQPMRVAVRLTNDGWAIPYKGRPVHLVLASETQVFTRALGAVDVRSFAPGGIYLVDETWTLPADIPAGDYALALWLPDADTQLQTDAAYAIRLANEGTWDPSRGWNVLAPRVRIGGGAADDGDASITDSARD